MLFADSPDGALFDFLKVLVFYVLSPLVLAVTGAVGILLKWNMRQQVRLEESEKTIRELEQSKKELKAVADTLKVDNQQKELEKGQLVQKVQELQSRINLHSDSCTRAEAKKTLPIKGLDATELEQKGSSQ